MVLIPASVYIMSSDQKRAMMEKKVLSSRIVRAMPIKKQESQIETITSKGLDNQEGKYAVYIKNLKTNEDYKFNADDRFDSASLYKLWVMAVVYQEIKDGNLKEDDVISASISSLDDVLSVVSPTPTPEGFIEPSVTGEPEKISMTVGEALEKMITVSDNYAAILLSSKIGNKKIASFIKVLGLTNSNYKQPPQTTAYDIGLYFEKLYSGEIVDKEYSDKMINLLKRQTLNDRLPKYLNADIEVAHKTGELFGSKHDAGIIYTKNGDYMIVVLSDTKDYDKAAENIARYSKDIFNYFNSKN